VAYRGLSPLTPSDLRNKLAFTVAHLFLNVYPDTIPTFLQPFLALLSPPDTSLSRQNFHPPSLATRLLSEIAQEIHDTTFRSARFWSETRQQRDGMIRDVIRSSGDERSAVDGMLGLAEKGLGVIEGGGNSEKQKWLEMVDLAMKTMATWTRGPLLPYSRSNTV